MLLRDDDYEEGSPVTKDTQEVGQNSREVLAAGDTCDGVDDETEECPEESGNHRERSAEGLNGETGRVGIRDVVCTSSVV